MIALRELRTCLLLAVLLLAGCAHSPQGEACAQPASGVSYCLLPPWALPVDGAPRLVHVSGPEIEQHLVSQLGMNNGELVFAASSLLGQPLFEIRHSLDAGKALVTTTPADAPVRATWLLAMLQIAAADGDAVAGALAGAQFQTNGEQRRIMRDEKVLMEIDRRQGEVIITLPPQRMRIQITELDGSDE